MLELHESLLDVRALSLTYRGGNGREYIALSNLELQIRAGESVGIFGSSGCGKTSLAS